MYLDSRRSPPRRSTSDASRRRPSTLLSGSLPDYYAEAQGDVACSLWPRLRLSDQRDRLRCHPVGALRGGVEPGRSGPRHESRESRLQRTEVTETELTHARPAVPAHAPSRCSRRVGRMRGDRGRICGGGGPQVRCLGFAPPGGMACSANDAKDRSGVWPMPTRNVVRTDHLADLVERLVALWTPSERE